MKLRIVQDKAAFFKQAKPSLYEPYMLFKVPSAKTLYNEILCRDVYVLITEHSLDEIKAHVEKTIPDELNILWALFHSVYQSTIGPYFYYRIVLDQIDIQLYKETKETILDVRKKIISALNELRYEIPGLGSLSSESKISLVLTPSESYEFNSCQINDFIPDYYQALCIYEKVISQLHECLSENPDEAVTTNGHTKAEGSLILDSLCLHSLAFTEIDEIEQRIIACMEEIVLDVNAANSLADSYEQRRGQEQGQDEARRAPSIRLTAKLDKINRYHDNNPNHRLTPFSHYYFSLVQYYFLLKLRQIIDNSNDLDLINEEKLVNEAMEKACEVKSDPKIQNCFTIMKWIESQKLGPCQFKEVKARELQSDIIDDLDAWMIVIEPKVSTVNSNSIDKKRYFNSKESMQISSHFNKHHHLKMHCGNYYSEKETQYKNGFFLAILASDLLSFNTNLIHDEDPQINDEHRTKKIKFSQGL